MAAPNVASWPAAGAVDLKIRSRRVWCIAGSAIAGTACIIAGTVAAFMLQPTSNGRIQHATPKRAISQEEAAAKALAVTPGAVVAGEAFIWFGIGDWGRCGSPTTNPSTRAGWCASQLSLVPSMEAWAAALAPTFIMSVGDQFYDGPMPVSGERDTTFPASAADLAAADADPIYDASFRQIYNTPTLRNTPWHMFFGNHDYGGLLAAQVNFGIRHAGQPGDDGYDNRWTAPALNYSQRYNIGSSSAPGACIQFIYVDTCPLMDTYRSSSNPNGGPDRVATTGVRPIFQKQINVIEHSMDQMAWFRDRLVEASNTCNAVVVGGHHAVFSSGQHARSARQQDLRVRLAFPDAFTWAGVDAYLGGHEHIVEYLEYAGTSYVVTGAGSDVRTNNVLVPQSLFLLEDNGFTVHSSNTTHMQHSIVDWQGDVVYTSITPLLPKQRYAPSPVPNEIPLNWLQPGYVPA